MDKKTILAFVLVGIIIILWPVYEERILGIKRPAKSLVKQQVQKPFEKTLEKPLPVTGALKKPSEKINPSYMIEKSDTLNLETDLFRGMISSSGGGTIISWRMKHFFDGFGKPVELIPDSSMGNLGMAIGNPTENQFDLSTHIFQIISNTKNVQNGKTRQTVIFRSDVVGLGRIEREISVFDGSYDILVKIRFLPVGTAKFAGRYFIYWKSGLAPTEKNIRDENGYYEAVALQGGEMLRSKSDATGLREGGTAWTAVRTKYFMASIIPVGSMGNATELKGEKKQILDSRKLPVTWKKLSIALAIPLRQLQEDTSSIICYLGPMDYHLLKIHGLQLEKNMNFGWILIRPFSIAFLYTLEFLHKLVRNYGWAIVIFAVIIKIVLQPLMKKSMKSMKQMQELQPKINALKEKYKNDTQRLNAETMKLYKTHGINPMGGCLPVILQMPILFALFNLFRTTIMLRQAGFLGVIKDLSIPDAMISIGQNTVNVLPVLMGVSMIVQQRLTMQDPKQKFTTYFMSIFMIYVFYNLAAGLNLYYLVFNVLTIAQEIYMKSIKPKVLVEG